MVKTIVVGIVEMKVIVVRIESGCGGDHPFFRDWYTSAELLPLKCCNSD